MVFPRIFGPMTLPSSCWRARTKMTKYSACRGDTSRIRKALGTAPRNGPKKGSHCLRLPPGYQGALRRLRAEADLQPLPPGAGEPGSPGRAAGGYHLLRLNMPAMPKKPPPTRMAMMTHRLERPVVFPRIFGPMTFFV